MKDALTRLPFLGLIVGLLLLFFPEATHDSHHNHLLHILLFGLPLSILCGVLLTQRKILVISGRFQVVTLVILLLFAGLHAAPIVETIKYHHQAQSSTEHPCCALQIIDSIATVEVSLVEKPIREPKQDQPKHPLQFFVKSVNNRSPPTLLS